MRFIDLTGKRFGRLVVLEYGRKKGCWVCQCECGVVTHVQSFQLTSGNTVSCGCKKKKHMQSYTVLYYIWAAMKRRCFSKGDKSYSRSGGRGITVCERWLDFRNFAEDMGPHPGKGMMLERINNDGPYAPWNCKWSTNKEQARNTRRSVLIVIDGMTKCLKDWAQVYNVDQNTLGRRLKHYKMPVELAVKFTEAEVRVWRKVNPSS